MATKKKLYHKRIVVDVLSETPIPDGMNLADLEYEMKQGDYVGNTETKKDQIVTGRKAAKMVMETGSDPMFFQMNEFGNEVPDGCEAHLESCDDDGFCNYCGYQ